MCVGGHLEFGRVGVDGDWDFDDDVVSRAALLELALALDHVLDPRVRVAYPPRHTPHVHVVG